MTTDLRERLQATLGTAYSLERELGGGGMSRVFVAADTRLGRQVVVKVLHPDLAAGLSAQRFEREVRLAARLQHPHIAPLLSAGELDGLPYYTMPFVEGETLRERLEREGALPIGDALRLVRELADALAYAHARGVVHRDLKPANVLLSAGHAVIVDFGVAKALASATRSVESPLSGAAATESGTAFGMAVGTPAYMAPEQAAADPSTDHRADLYALGLIAYEMLTGMHPFAGRSTQAMLAAHLTESPAPVAERRRDVPRQLAELVVRLLAKRPDDRPSSATEVMRALDDLTTPAGGVRAPARSTPRTSVLIAGGIAALLVVAGVAVAWRARAASAVEDRVAVDHTPPVSRQLTFTGNAEDPEFSRDGRQVAYVDRQCVPAPSGDSTCTVTLKVLDRASMQSDSLVSGSYIAHPHWSADDAWIVALLTPTEGEYRDSAGTYLVSRHGGAPHRIAPPSLAEFGAFGDTLLIAASNAPGAPRFVRRMRATTGETIDSTALAATLVALEGFHASPDGRWLALRLADRLLLATPDRHVTDSIVFRNHGSLRWDPRGDALYAVTEGHGIDSWLLGIRVDRQHGRFVGGAMDTVRYLGPSIDVTFDVAPDGQTLVHTGGMATMTQWALDRDARPPVPRRLAASTAWLSPPLLSTDGQFIGYDMTDASGENVYVRPFTGGSAQPLTRDSIGLQAIGWLPGTHQLLYRGFRPTDSVYAQEVPDGVRRVVGGPGDVPLADGSTVALDPTGRALVFRSARSATRVVTLPDSLGQIASLGRPDDDAGGVLVEMTRAAAGALPHPRAVHVDRVTGAFWTVVEFKSTQGFTVLGSRRGEVSYATWPVRRQNGHPTVWRAAPGHAPVRVAELPLECVDAWLTMSADGRRFACSAMTRQPDLYLIQHFGRPASRSP